MNIVPLDFKKFLVKAKINTYAKSGEGNEQILGDGCREFVYIDGEYKYRDRYFGFNPFIGQEVVFCENEVVWGMNYYGFIISDSVSAKLVYNFLKKALRQVTEDKPFRGPKDFKENDFEYKNQSYGGIDNFYGEEKIVYQDKEIYKLYYHGGRVVSK